MSVDIVVPTNEYDSPFNVMTSGNVINLDAFKAVGGFSDEYFIDCVDFDFCAKLRQCGYQILRLNKIKLNHSLGKYKKKVIFGKAYTSFEHSALRRYYIVRNRLYFCNKFKDVFPEYCGLEKKCSRKELKLV